MNRPKRRARLNDPAVFPNVSEEHAAAIGYVAMRWTAVEDSLVPVIGALLRIERPATLALLGGRTNPAVLGTISALVQLSGDSKSIADWQALSGRIEQFRPKRNSAVHAEWTPHGSDAFASRSKVTNRLTFSFDPVSSDDLNTLADQLLILAEEIVRFAGELARRKIVDAVISPYPPGLQTPHPTSTKKLDDVRRVAPRSGKLSSAQKRAAAQKTSAS